MHYNNSGTLDNTLRERGNREGNGGGVGNREEKALFFPFEVGKMPGRPFRTKKSVSTNLSSIEGRGRGHFFLLSMFLFKLPFYLK